MSSVPRESAPPLTSRHIFGDAWALWLGAAILAVPTFITLAREYWSLEQGGHGPIVLATGIWLLWTSRAAMAAVAEPGKPWLAALLFVPSLLGYIFARMTGMLGIECLGFYGAFIAIFYYHAGMRVLKLMWFPLVYFLFMFPQPETLILPLSHALKLLLSTAAVALLSQFGFQVGQGGVVLYVDQYELLVATACSGLHSLIGLSSIGVFYCYTRYAGDWRSAVPLLVLIPPIALLANFIRVVVLILVTHYFGDHVAQVYVHDVAGIMLFVVAVLMMLGADSALEWARGRIRPNGRARA